MQFQAQVMAMAVMTDIGSSSNHLVERVRLVEPVGLASSSLCCTAGRKSTATEARLSVLLITGEKLCAALRVGQPATVVLMSGRSRTRLGCPPLFAGPPGLKTNRNPQHCWATDRVRTT